MGKHTDTDTVTQAEVKELKALDLESADEEYEEPAALTRPVARLSSPIYLMILFIPVALTLGGISAYFWVCAATVLLILSIMFYDMITEKTIDPME